MVVVVDDEDRENEGDLTVAAEKVTPEVVNFMATHGRGLICMPMIGERLDALDIPLMVEENTSTLRTAFCVSIEAREGVTTGISAADRARTVLAAIHPDTAPTDLVRPGHVFPLRARPGGVLQRAGQTEAGVDLARIAGLYPAAVICEVMKDDGTMARLPDLMAFAGRHGLGIVSVADLIRYRLRTESLVRRLAETVLPTRFGTFRTAAYENTSTRRSIWCCSSARRDPIGRCWCESTASASPARSSAPSAVTAVRSSKRRSRESGTKAPGCCST